MIKNIGNSGNRMLECIIIGDSIAVGTKQFKPECVSYSKIGISSHQWNKNFGHNRLESDITIISLGSNDHQYVKTERELRSIREKVKSKHVYWILPAIKPHVQEIVKKIQLAYGDRLIEIKHLQSDKIHPSTKGYKAIAESAK